MDIVSFFDKENIFDCLETMDRLGVNQKAARVWYKLNKDTQVAVKTTCGMTETAEVGDCLGQGTAGAGLVLQANLDHGLNSYFQGCKEVMYYGETRIQPLSYQDDVGAPCLDVSMARVQASLLASPDKTRQDWIPDPRCKELHRKNKKLADKKPKRFHEIHTKRKGKIQIPWSSAGVQYIYKCSSNCAR